MPREKANDETFELRPREVKTLYGVLPPNFRELAAECDLPYEDNADEVVVCFDDLPGIADHPLLKALRRAEIMHPRHSEIILEPA